MLNIVLIDMPHYIPQNTFPIGETLCDLKMYNMSIPYNEKLSKCIFDIEIV